MKKPKKYGESELQQNCVTWFRLKYRNEKHLLFAIPNGGSRNVIEAVRLKKEGVVAGVADLLLLKGNSEYHGLFIEMKIGDGEQSDSQITFEKYCFENKYQYVTCWSLTSFMDAVENYLKII